MSPEIPHDPGMASCLAPPIALMSNVAAEAHRAALEGLGRAPNPDGDHDTTQEESGERPVRTRLRSSPDA